MATSTYLTLVNNSILEAGADLAFFASDGSDFDDPPTVMHRRFKKWVADAWRDIQQTAPDWHFSVQQDNVRLHPRIAFARTSAVGATTTLPTGVDWEICSGGDTSEVFQTIPIIDGKIRQGVLNSSTLMDCEGYLDIDGDEAEVIDFNLHVGSTVLHYQASGPTVLINAVIAGWGSYDFNEVTQNISTPSTREVAKQIDHRSFRITDFGSDEDEGSANFKERVLVFVPWTTFQDHGMDLASNNAGVPTHITQDYEGRYRFYPPLNKDATLIFTFEKGVQLLEEDDDVPETIPEEFVDVIMWRAIQYYGQYDEQPSISNTQYTGRADRQVKVMLQRLERQTRESFHFRPTKLW